LKAPITLRAIILGLLLAPLVCYLEWGKDQSGFLFAMEYDLIANHKLSDSIRHPLVLLPMAGQLILLFTLFQRTPNRKLVWVSMLLLGTLVMMILLAGTVSLNVKIILSTMPFLMASTLFILATRKKGDPKP
jgi:hypothetical protein